MTVYLVGAGPGDPTLLTLRAADLLAKADVVVFDRLVDARALDLVAKTAELIDVGKQTGAPRDLQDTINALLIDRAARHRFVVRLKGGDPFVFGRGGEEALALGRAGIDYEIVPGVSSLSAVPAYAGVPLTMRGVSSSVVVVTGHDPDEELDAGSIDWLEIGKSNATVVILMGAAMRAEIAQRLLDAGRPRSTPVLVVERGTTPSQRSTRTSLEELGSLSIRAPATIVVGEVARVDLASFEGRPLFSWRIVVTRSSGQSPAFVRDLASSGALAIEFPTIEIRPPADGGVALRERVQHLGEYEWVVFTSSNAVERVMYELVDLRAFGRSRVAAVGASTASALRVVGLVADLVATESGSASLLDEFPASNGQGRVLLPRSAIARPTLADGLVALGWDVDAVDAYETHHPVATSEALSELDGADAITFSSSSTVMGFLQSAGMQRLPRVVASIGPETTKTARSRGIEVSVEATTHTAEGLLDALVAYARAHPKRPDEGSARLIP